MKSCLNLDMVVCAVFSGGGILRRNGYLVKALQNRRQSFWLSVKELLAISSHGPLGMSFHHG